MPLKPFHAVDLRTHMKTHQIELQRLKAATISTGSIELQVDVSLMPGVPRGDDMPTSVLRMNEETARVLQALLKAQLLELDKRKARSRHG